MFKQRFSWRFMQKFILFPYFLVLYWFSNMIYHMHLFYPYRSFKHSKWWRH